MKASPTLFRSLFALASLAFLPALPAQLFWDPSGSGSAELSGHWNLQTPTWNPTPGEGPPQAWNNDGTVQAIFLTGGAAPGDFSVVLNAGSNIQLAGLTLLSGSLTLSGATDADTLDFGALPAALHTEWGAEIDILTPLLGSAGLVKSGSGQVRLTAAGPAGPWNLQGGRLVLGASQQVSTLTLAGDDLLAAVLELQDGIHLDLEGNINFTNVGQTETAAIRGGTLHLNGDRSIVIPNSPAAIDLEISSVIADGSQPSSLTKSNNAGVLLLSGNNTYTGATILAGSNAGTLLVQGNEASIAGSSEVIIQGAVLTLGSLSDTARVNRLRDDASLTLAGVAAAGATVNYNGPDEEEPGAHVEVLGEIIVRGQNRSYLTLTPGSDNELELRATGLSRLENGVLLLRGKQLGTMAGITETTRLVLENAPELVGGEDGAGILPWAVGDISETGVGSGFLTYDSRNGLRLLDASEYTAPELAFDGANVRKSAAGSLNLNLPVSVTVNSWTNAATGTLTLGPGLTLGVQSGAMLFTSNGTISGGSIALAEHRQGIIHLAASTALTATINSSISGSHGLLLSGTGTTGNRVLVLGGDNSFTGGVLVYSSILQLNNPGALNPLGVNAVTLQTGSTLRLNGNSVTIAGLSGTGNLTNNHATNDVVLTINGGGTHTGAINNGSTASLGLIKTGTDLLTLGGNNGYTGATQILNGNLHVQPTGNNPGGNGGLRGTSEIFIGKGALLQINNGNVAAANNADRINDNAPLFLLGTLNYQHPSSNINYSETLGSLTLGRAASQITASSAGASGTSTLSFTSFAGRETGGVVNFSGSNLGVADTNQGRNQIRFQEGLSEGFIGGWATVDNEFAHYSHATGVSALPATAIHTGDQGDWTAATHAKPDSAQTLDADRDLLSLNITGNGPKNIQLGGHLLDLHSGGLIKQGGSPGGTGATNVATISGGRLTAGGSSDGELFLRVTGANLNISASIVDNPGDGITPGSVSLVKSGAGTVVLTGVNSFSGGLILHEGVVVVNNSGTTGTGSVFVGQGARIGGTGTIGSLTSGARITLDKGGNLFVGSATALGAQTLTLQADEGFLFSGSIELDIIGGGAKGSANNPSGNNDRIVFTNAQGSGQGSPELNGALLKINTNLPITSDSWTAGSSWKLFDWYGLTTSFDNLPADGSTQGNPLYLPDLSTLGLSWDWSQLYTNGTLAIIAPEPGRAMLLMLGFVLTLLRRSRSHPKSTAP